MEQFTFQRDKFKSLVHYICHVCSDYPARLGAVKLNKILWFSDVFHYGVHGVPITAETYIKDRFGPRSMHLKSVLSDLESEDAIDVEQVDFHGWRKWEYRAKKAPNVNNVFSPDEFKLINDLIAVVTEKHTAVSISELSHGLPWRVAQRGEEIPYFAIFGILQGEIPDDVLDEARSVAEEIARTKSSTPLKPLHAARV